MKKLVFDYEMKLTFSSPVTDHRFQLRCVPATGPRQQVVDVEVAIEPDVELETTIDSFDSVVMTGFIPQPHTIFSYSVKGIAFVDNAHIKSEIYKPLYRFNSALTIPGPCIEAMIAACRARIAPPDAKRHTVMADGTYMGHGWRLIIAIDGESGEVLAFQWRAYEELRRCCRRLEKLFRAGDSSPFPGRRLPQGGRWRAPRTGWRAASTRASRTCCATRGLPEEHMLRACEWVCYMKTAHPRPESFIPDDPLEDGKATSPEPEGDASPAYGIGIDWNEFHTGTRYPNGTD